ncbi:unnamed protein product, partial [Nippostrongylus brasiliensis]|uniref:DUF5641 domain-containing protein n=1 Tax=Nippostrongylus brasiliensis TaxID=27835 RepID=A0A0N4XM42_NIPBR
FLPLRPTDFTRPTANLSLPCVLAEEDEWKPYYSTKDQLISAWRYTLTLLDNFWERWQKEYLTCLRERHQNTHPHPRSYHDSNQRRENMFSSMMNSISKRSVRIRLPSQRIITRPINLISRFEVDTTQSTPQKPPEEPTTPITSAPHPMITRSKARQLLQQNVSLLSFLIIALVVPTIRSTNTRCPDELTIDKEIFYVTPCVTNGIAIAKFKEYDRSHICWFPVSCPSGQIQRLTDKGQNANVLNGLTTPEKEQSKISNVPQDFIDFVPTEVCAFNKDSACSPKKRIGIFNQVELYDGTKLLVSSIHVTIKEFADTDDFICFNSNGKRVHAAPPYKGSHVFCKAHKCNFRSNKFCMYDTPVALFDFSDNNTQNLIPIRAWGTTTRQFYPHNSESTLERALLTTQCSKGGVVISSDRAVNTVKSCIQSYCVFSHNMSHTQILFPTELVVFKYTVIINVWDKGKHQRKLSLTCSS